MHAPSSNDFVHLHDQPSHDLDHGISGESRIRLVPVAIIYCRLHLNRGIEPIQKLVIPEYGRRLIDENGSTRVCIHLLETYCNNVSQREQLLYDVSDRAVLMPRLERFDEQGILKDAAYVHPHQFILGVCLLCKEFEVSEGDWLSSATIVGHRYQQHLT
jgi:hypothetical protein